MNSKAYNIFSSMQNEFPKVDIEKSCSAEQNRSFTMLAEMLAELHENNPLNKNEEGYNEYEDLIYFYDLWPKKNRECAFIKRFVYAAYELCKLRQDNIFEKKNNIKNQDKEQNTMNHNKEQYKTFNNAKKVFGVVPEDKQKKDEI